MRRGTELSLSMADRTDSNEEDDAENETRLPRDPFPVQRTTDENSQRKFYRKAGAHTETLESELLPPFHARASYNPVSLSRTQENAVGADVSRSSTEAYFGLSGSRLSLTSQSSEGGVRSSSASELSADGNGDNLPQEGIKLSLQYAIGLALRTKVLNTLLEETSQASHASILAFVSNHIQGLAIYIYGTIEKDNRSPLQVRIHAATKDDSKRISNWWDHDRVLSYASKPWNRWWIRRCNRPEKGCRMIKLVLLTGEILGVAYYRESQTMQTGGNSSYYQTNQVTNIEGIRVAPPFNKEVARRLDYLESDHLDGIGRTVIFQGVASALLSHIVYASLMAGTDGVATLCEKNEVAERFYKERLGLPVRLDESDGRRLYCLLGDEKWEYIRRAFRRQIYIVQRVRNLPPVSKVSAT